MKKIIYFLCIIALLIHSADLLNAQDNCGTILTDNVSLYHQGLYKPYRTDSAANGYLADNVSFNIIIVFMQFPEDNIDLPDWPAGQPPTYMNNLLAERRNNVGDFWSRYDKNTQFLSDYYQELSLGKFHVTGIVKHYVMNKRESQYANITEINNEIYQKLQVDLENDFSQYDKWTCLGDGQISYEPDQKLDMLYMVRKKNPVCTYNDPGWAGLDGSDFEIDTQNHIMVNATGQYMEQNGSGLVIQGNSSGQLGFSRFMGIALHEYGHYLWGYHKPTGVMTARGGISINDLFSSPFEKIQLGYITPNEVNYSTSEYTLGDISCRNSNNNIIKVPISSNEYFYITNRRGISDYDKAMLGDTTGLDINKNTGELGKGVYIYHGRESDSYHNLSTDIECADGLWNWVVNGTTTPDWSNSQNVLLIVRNELPLSILNDNSPYGGDYYNSADGQSVNRGERCWFSSGKRHTQLFQLGTDKIYTNTPEWWTSRELYGDRKDAWNLGYNEIFSPYSNPNTKNYSDNNTGIFIYYNGLTNNNASFKIYKVGEGGYNEETILYLTPPSKPQILNIEEYWNGRTCKPKIIWRQNTEPDMVNSDVFPDRVWKRYKIYRSSNIYGMGHIPPDKQFYPEQVYQHIATVDVDPSTTDASWIDNDINLYYCAFLPGAPSGVKYPIRYRVQAVDRYSTSSVLSDFKQTIGVTMGVGDPSSDGLLSIENDEIPSNYSLSQNYPNPFNPVTKINYAIPNQGFVSLKVFDMLGREIATLVNDVKQAGFYSVDFNASEYSSGIYFYRIEAGTFREIKRMVLIK